MVDTFILCEVSAVVQGQTSFSIDCTELERARALTNVDTSSVGDWSEKPEKRCSAVVPEGPEGCQVNPRCTLRLPHVVP